ncbi:MAG: MFS transporter [Chloroflexota bacterium]|nr:MFS transporter [Chloroflexota bacterium]
MNSSIRNVLIGTFTLRFSTGLTGAMLVYFIADFADHGGTEVSAVVVGLFTALFFVAELVLSPPFGLLSDRWGFHRVMQYGPIFGAVAVILTGLVPLLLSADLGVISAASLVTIALVVIGGTRLLEGASTAASVPSILGYLAQSTADDEGLRGKVSARFELATILGIGAGLGAAGVFWLLGPVAFFINGAFYIGSLLIYRYGVTAPDKPAGPHHQPSYGWQRYVGLLRRSHVWLLAPTWIAVNAALGLYSSQGLYALVRTPNPLFNECVAPSRWFSCQLLAGGFDSLQVTGGLIVAGAVFVLGLIWWGNRFKSYRRTTIILFGIAGGAVLVASALLVNHAVDVERIVGVARGLPIALALPGVAFGLFVLAGATPAALGLLSDMSEAFPDDRGAIMGLYSVFLALGQITGALIGGEMSQKFAFDGILLATLVLLAIALAPLAHLRRYEHHFSSPAAS